VDAPTLAAQQLARMRGMTGLYHRQFFRDTTVTTVLVVLLLVVGWGWVEEAFLVIPVVALIGAAQTAFDASYLMFARSYAERLEGYLNDAVGERVLVAAELEATYLFELRSRKVVTIPIDGPFTWFGFMTVLYTVVGVAAYVFGLALGWDTLMAASTGLIVGYLIVLLGTTAVALIIGLWWFAGGEGERRLQNVFDERFGKDLGDSR
jgi:hypothetical protein